MNCGLLGRKLGHSYSPQIHAHLGNYSYRLFEKEPEELESFLKESNLTGLNVTIPYKKAVIPFCDKLTPQAQAIGAVNTIVRSRDGSLIGHNTDYFGLEQMLKACKVSISGKKALVLGSGGASNTAVAVLNDYGANTVVVSRNGVNHYENLHLHKDAVLIVNATPVGMYPNNGYAPVNIKDFPNVEQVLDMIYNPARTRLVQDAQACQIPAMNGLLMLVAQAKESAEWFLGHKIDDQKITDIYRLLRRQMENIVLIGMPGSGKSTLGRMLAERTGKRFVDADDFLEADSGRKIPEIFAADGEVLFRKLETKVLSQLGKESGIVLATGGGCVTRRENYALLHQNSTIFCIERNLENLATEGRPLSQMGKLSEMLQIRQPLYAEFADYTIDNNQSAESALAQIMGIWEECV